MKIINNSISRTDWVYTDSACRSEGLNCRVGLSEARRCVWGVVRTCVSSEQEAMLKSSNGFHLMSVMGAEWPVTRR